MLCVFVSARHSWVKQTFWKVKKIPSASFRKNTVQSSSILNRIKFITAYPRQYKRKRSQYFDTFSQLSHCNCKADIYEAGSLFAAWFLYCIPRSPALDLALWTCVHLHGLNSLHKKDQITSLHLPKEGYGLNYIFIESHLLEAFRDLLRRVQKMMCAAVAPDLLRSLAFSSVLRCSFTVFRKSIKRSCFTDSWRRKAAQKCYSCTFFLKWQIFFHPIILARISEESVKKYLGGVSFSLCCYCCL